MKMRARFALGAVRWRAAPTRATVDGAFDGAFDGGSPVGEGERVVSSRDGDGLRRTATNCTARFFCLAISTSLDAHIGGLVVEASF